MGYGIRDLGKDVMIDSNVELGRRNADFVMKVFNELDGVVQYRLVERVYGVSILFSEQLENGVMVIVRYRAHDEIENGDIIYEAEVIVFDDGVVELVDVIEVEEGTYYG